MTQWGKQNVVNFMPIIGIKYLIYTYRKENPCHL